MVKISKTHKQLNLENESDFTLEIPSKMHLTEMVNCIQETFPAPTGEPMANALGIRAFEYRSYAELVCRKAISDKLSVIAIDNLTKQVVGFLISEPLKDAREYSKMKVSSRFLPLLSLLENLDKHYCDAYPERVKDTCHFYMLGVHRLKRGLGLSNRLVDYGMELARKSLFKYGLCEATGKHSQRLLNELGFKEEACTLYENFFYKKGQPFRNIEKGLLGCKLFSCKL